MKKNTHLCLLITVLYSFYTTITLSQCTCRAANNSFTTLTAPPPYTGADYFNGVSYSTYIRLTAAVGNVYTVSLSGCSNPNVYISITSGTAGGAIIACGSPPLSFTASTTAYFVHYFENSGCGGTLGYSCGGRLTYSLTSALSVELISFTGEATIDGNELQWSTRTETNNDYFELEATTDGNSFKTIGRVKGTGNSKDQQDYRFLDHTTEKIMYYRLRQIDFDGNSTHHPLVMVDRVESKEVMISPNPTTKVLYADLNVSTTGNYNFSFLNALETSMEKNIMLTKGSNRVEIDVSEELVNGFYILRISDENGILISTCKFVKE